MRLPGGPELLIILVIVILIFGVGRIGKVMKEIGTGVREFRKGVQGEEEPKPPATTTNNDQQPKS